MSEPIRFITAYPLILIGVVLVLVGILEHA